MMGGLAWLSQLEDVRGLLAARGQGLDYVAPRLDRAVLARVHRVLWGQATNLEPGVSEEFTSLIFPVDATPGPGLCAALNEQLPALQLQRALLAKFYPDDLDRVERLVARLTPHCRASVALRAWRDKISLPALPTTRVG